MIGVMLSVLMQVTYYSGDWALAAAVVVAVTIAFFPLL